MGTSCRPPDLRGIRFLVVVGGVVVVVVVEEEDYCIK
jgi:hypothetical protein